MALSLQLRSLAHAVHLDALRFCLPTVCMKVSGNAAATRPGKALTGVSASCGTTKLPAVSSQQQQTASSHVFRAALEYIRRSGHGSVVMESKSFYRRRQFASHAAEVGSAAHRTKVIAHVSFTILSWHRLQMHVYAFQKLQLSSG